jgi:hypothetical protein
MQLLLLFYYPSMTKYTVVANISNFPETNFVQTFGTYFDLLLVPFTSNVYMSSRCGQQEWFNGTNCVAFTCNDPHCVTCSNLPNVCTTCASSYNVASDGSCSNLSNTTSTFNSTNNANQTNANTINSTNSTNLTADSNTTDLNNSTNSTNSTVPNNATN